MSQTGKSRYYRPSSGSTTQTARERIQTNTYVTPTKASETDIQKLVRLANTRADKGVKGVWSDTSRNAVRRPDGRLTVDLKKGNTWVRGTYDINPEWEYRNINGVLVHDERPLLPWNQDFWDAAGSILGDPTIWKRAGVELWKSSFGLDVGHIAKEFEGDLAGAEADLDNYDAKQFGIDIAIMLATWGAFKAGGAVAKFASQTVAGQKALQQAGRARNALRQIASGAIKKIGVANARQIIREGSQALKQSIQEAGQKGTAKLSQFRKSLLNNELITRDIADNVNEDQLKELSKSLLRGEDIYGASASSRIGQLETQITTGQISPTNAGVVFYTEEGVKNDLRLANVAKEYGTQSQEYADALVDKTVTQIRKGTYTPPTATEVGIAEDTAKQADDLATIALRPPEEEQAKNLLEKYGAEIEFSQQIGEKPEAREAFLQVDTGGDLPRTFEYQPDVSTQEIGVWLEGDKLHIHFTGAYTPELKKSAIGEGWTGRGALGQGKTTQEALAKIEQVLAKYPDANLYLSGYSKGGGMVNDVMTQYANNARIKEALAIAPNTSTLDTLASQASATARGTAKEMENKITTIRMANDPISENGLPYGKTITIQHPSAGGLEAHNIEIWSDEGVKVVSGKSQQLKTIDQVADVIKETTTLGGREARKGGEDALDADTVRSTGDQTKPPDAVTGDQTKPPDAVTVDQPTTQSPDAVTVDQPPTQSTARVVVDDFETVQIDDTIIFGRDAYTAQEEIAASENLDQLTGDFTDEVIFIPDYMQGSAPEQVADYTASKPKSHFAEDRREDTGHYTSSNIQPIPFTPTPPPPQILGYCVYPASLETQYLNRYVEF
jgi:hypothetical protein